MRDHETVEKLPASNVTRDVVWDSLRSYELNRGHLARNRIVAAAPRHPAAGAIDLLRTRILNAAELRGWRHIGITSPDRNCGKTFLSANLGVSLSRQKHLRTLLFDMDLRNPSLSRVLGLPRTGALLPALEGREALLDRALRLSENFAVVSNEMVTDGAAEILRSSTTVRVLAHALEQLRPDIALYDLPPALVCDDVLSFKHRLDALVLVVHGGHSTPKQIRSFEALMANEIPILATVLNEAEGTNTSHYMGN